MKKVYETPMTEVILQVLYDRLCTTGVVSPGEESDDPSTNERNDNTESEEIWNKEW